MACPVKLVFLFVLNILLSLYGCVCGNKTNPYFVDVDPHEKYPFLLQENKDAVLTFSMKQYCCKTVKIVPVSTDTGVLDASSNTSESLHLGTVHNFTVKIKGNFLGRTFVKLFMNKTAVTDAWKYDLSAKEMTADFDWYELPDKYEVVVSRKESALSHSFTGIVIILVSLANIAMGCKTKLSVVKEVLRKPIGPLTGMFSQFVLMPLIALAVIFMLKFDPANALGFFAMACSPGGAASNLYSYLLAGDVSLSVTMTLCSTLLSLGMIPLWLFTVGQKVLYRTDVQIPYTNILYSLVGLIIPVAIGMVIRWKKPNWAKFIVKCIRPLMIVFFILVFSLGVYTNLYIFTLMRKKPEILLAGALVPYIGFIFGGLVAMMTRQSWKRVRTIAIETGIQNTGIAIVLLKVSLSPPDNDISIVAPIASAIFTPIPMLIAIVWYEVYKRCYKKKEVLYLDDQDHNTDHEHGEGDNPGETVSNKDEEKEVKFSKEREYIQLNGNNNVKC